MHSRMKSDIFNLSVKETGENPVRARRRVVHFTELFLPDAANRGKSHWSLYSEKAEKLSTLVEIFYR